MITRTNTKTAVALLLAATALAGCGDGDEAADVPAPTTVASTPVDASVPAVTPETKKIAASDEGKWATQLCTEMAGKVGQIKPPTIDDASPEGTQKGLVAFFDEVVKQQGAQLSTMKSVGPPPGDKAGAEWKTAMTNLRKVRSEVTTVKDDLEATTPGNKAELAKQISGLGKQLESLGAYGGPIGELKASKNVGAALSVEPACAKVS